MIPPPTPVPPSGPPPSPPPPYPPAIKAPDFIDKDPVKAPDADTMEWTLNVEAPPKTEKSGVKARLHNLGIGSRSGFGRHEDGTGNQEFPDNFLKNCDRSVRRRSG